jgi:hypothetical protein
MLAWWLLSASPALGSGWSIQRAPNIPGATVSSATPKALSGTFNGSWNQGGILAQWHGTISYAKVLSSSPSATSYGPTSATVSWSVSGSSGGCTDKGSGQFSIANGMLKGYPVGGYADVYSNGAYDIDLNTVAQGPIDGYNSWPVTITCPPNPPFTGPYMIDDWIDSSHHAGSYYLKNGRLNGSDSYSNPPYYTWSWNWDLGADSEPLVAKPGGPYTVDRGGTVDLDGSSSTPSGKIQSYKWTFQPGANCPPGTSLDQGAVKEGARASVVALCSLHVKLTVANGSSEASATTSIKVQPRKWETPVVQEPYTFSDPGFNPPPPVITKTSSGKPKLNEDLGLNVSACKGASEPARRYAEQLVCPLRTNGSWLDHGFQVSAPVNDPHGPFNGFYYVTAATFEVVRQGLLNHWLAPNAPPLPGAVPNRNFYIYNQRHGTDITGYITALKQHEGLGKPGVARSGHTLAIEEAMATEKNGQPLDPRAIAERQLAHDRADLVNTIDDKVLSDEDALFAATQDPLPVIWGPAPVWLWSTDFGQWLQFNDSIGDHD